MFVRTTTLTWKQPLQDAVLAAMSAAPVAALLVTPKLHLIKNQAAPIGQDYDPVNLATDECDFTGYAAVTIGALSAPYNNADEDRAVHKECNFAKTGAPENQFAYWILVTDTTNLIVYFWELLETPVPFAFSGDILSYDLVISQPVRSIGS